MRTIKNDYNENDCKEDEDNKDDKNKKNNDENGDENADLQSFVYRLRNCLFVKIR